LGGVKEVRVETWLYQRNIRAVNLALVEEVALEVYRDGVRVVAFLSSGRRTTLYDGTREEAERFLEELALLLPKAIPGSVLLKAAKGEKDRGA